ncbi:formylglycine-generating enzyme family protein [Myxococcota bacterium]|nr:formylglycine-generating enzyme family protein [Myxococcota bacterium]
MSSKFTFITATVLMGLGGAAWAEDNADKLSQRQDDLEARIGQITDRLDVETDYIRLLFDLETDWQATRVWVASGRGGAKGALTAFIERWQAKKIPNRHEAAATRLRTQIEALEAAWRAHQSAIEAGDEGALRGFLAAWASAEVPNVYAQEAQLLASQAAWRRERAARDAQLESRLTQLEVGPLHGDWAATELALRQGGEVAEGARLAFLARWAGRESALGFVGVERAWGALRDALPATFKRSSGEAQMMLNAFIARWSKEKVPQFRVDWARKELEQPYYPIWIELSGGSFQMGSNKGDSDERPVHEVRLKGFMMSKTEVTVGQYRACVNAGVCTAPDTSTYCNWNESGRELHPINCVDWNQAKAFATWAGGRLPTEAEWEYAARSGGKDQEYPWGNAQVTCNYAVMDHGGNGCGRGNATWPVCSKPQGNTEQGMCDMSGNVWEWVADYYGSYDSTPRDGTEHLSGSNRVFRGGGWFNYASSLRAARRYRYVPSNRYFDLGFRLARSLP